MTEVVEKASPATQKTVRTYDFRRPKYLAAEQMKNIHRAHSGVAEAVRERLTRLLGADVDVRMESAPEEIAFGLFSSESGLAECYTLVLDLSPLPDRGLLLLDSRICLSFVDRILGGRSRIASTVKGRPLTAIDQAAAEGVIEMILRCFREGWKELALPAKMTVVDRRPAFDQVQFVTAGEAVLTVTLALKGDLGEGRIRLCVPVGSLKAMFSAGDATGRNALARNTPEKAATIRRHLTLSIEKAALPVTATVGRAEVPLRNLMRLHAGDIVRLDQPAEAPVLVSVGGKPAFLARMGLRGRSKALQIVQCLDTAGAQGISA